MEQKRSPCSVDEGYLISLASKRHKAQFSISAKTDTASVLLEAMEYIQFLHEQIKVLIAPYLERTPMSRIQEIEPWSLGSNGLCLVPIASTSRIASCNGADIWAPVKTSSSDIEKNVLELQ
ncbi:transcription factor bHLH154-like isoform X2 [Momordica charantia]|uniref:Transcription factor bHLH154-like isoform X2 n=1 Tax=Momordica charantia TaxID=3673 RepID=A0A6J1DQ86_MOMCH|nr:transcription factor bHLH154-like isoform X2 [Momordica charantia]